MTAEPDTTKTITSRAEAKASGLPRYYTGRPCPRGHFAERRTKCGGCTQCKPLQCKKWREKNHDWNKERVKRWKANNVDRAKEYQREYNNKTREIQREQARARYKLDPSSFLIRQREAYARNPERFRSQKKAWRLNNLELALELSRKSYKENPERYKIVQRNRRARVRNAPGTHTAREVADLFKRQKAKCAEPSCRSSLKSGYHADHIIALANGGTNWIWNIQLLCPACNRTKSDKPLHQWARENGRLL